MVVSLSARFKHGAVVRARTLRASFAPCTCCMYKLPCGSVALNMSVTLPGPPMAHSMWTCREAASPSWKLGDMLQQA